MPITTTSAGQLGIVDPLAYQMFVSKSEHPQGIFLSAIGLFFATKDANVPVSVEIRPMINGYPSSREVYPMSVKYKNPEEVNISEDGSAETKFVFDAPIYIAPGEFCLVIKTNCDSYEAYCAEVGAVDIASNTLIDRQPYLGSLFKSQNGSTWTAEQFEDLKIKVYKCVFDTSLQRTAQFNVEAPTDSNTVFHAVKLTGQEQNVPGFTFTNYSLDVRDAQAGTQSGLFDIMLSEHYNVKSEKLIRTDQPTDMKMQVRMSSLSSDVSPVIDLSRSSIFAVKNLINATNAASATPETLSSGGYANAKYVTKMVTLQDAIDASSLNVTMDIARLRGTSVEVYYKILSSFDDTPFDDRPYVKMTPIPRSIEFTDSDTKYLEFTWQDQDITYTGPNGGTYNSFRYFAIKIVMFSDNPAYVPNHKRLRVIATS